MVFSGLDSDGQVPHHGHECINLLGNLIRGETATFTSLLRSQACPVGNTCLMLLALLGLFVDVTPNVFLPMARIDTTGQTT